MTQSEARPRVTRLATRADRGRCLDTGRRRRSEWLEFIWIDNTAGHPRMGLIVPRFQSTAVARNRLRRRLTEIWRRQVRRGQGATDLIIRIRREAYSASFAELRTAMLGLARVAFGGSHGE
ncbi:MAG: ribonuclease P protein component [Gemmatimonadota bacterium]|nr:ribonuclease P protein component [Gemmatimonadota bacterium]MDH4347324.1 ribonuclease P protein component [Gemmatimonadota bacterium]